MVVIEHSDAVEEFIETHDSVKALPEASLRILKLAQDPRSDLRPLLHLIQQDPALSARLMRAVNSAFYSLPTKITRLDRAATHMGLRAVKEIAISSSLASLSGGVSFGTYGAQDLWHHSLAVAVAAHELAIYSKKVDADDAYLAGMLHDVGLLLSTQGNSKHVRQLFERAETASEPFTSLERELLGFDHCELGGRAADLWKFPEQIAAAIRWHHDPSQAPGEFQPLCKHIFVADTCAAQAGIGFPLTCRHQEMSPAVLAEANVPTELANEIGDRLKVLLRLYM